VRLFISPGALGRVLLFFYELGPDSAYFIDKAESTKGRLTTNKKFLGTHQGTTHAPVKGSNLLLQLQSKSMPPLRF
jgi:hypothetical protein